MKVGEGSSRKVQGPFEVEAAQVRCETEKASRTNIDKADSCSRTATVLASPATTGKLNRAMNVALHCTVSAQNGQEEKRGSSSGSSSSFSFSFSSRQRSSMLNLRLSELLSESEEI